MDIGDFKKIKTQQDLRDYIVELDNALEQIIMNDGVICDTSLYSSLRLCRDCLYHAKIACRQFDVEMNSFKDE